MTSDVEEWERDKSFAINMAAADLAVDVVSLMHRAFAARADIDQQKLAELLGVTPGRVSQIMSGDGNVHVATLGRWLRALGYQARVDAEPADADAPALVRRRRTARAQGHRSRVFSVECVDPSGGFNGVMYAHTSAEAHDVLVGRVRELGTERSHGRIERSSDESYDFTFETRLESVAG